MPSFDIVSKTNLAEIDNAINELKKKFLIDTILKNLNLR